MSERTLFIYLTTRIVRADRQSARFLLKYGVIGKFVCWGFGKGAAGAEESGFWPKLAGLVFLGAKGGTERG
jgi:hypothetical protein